MQSSDSSILRELNVRRAHLYAALGMVSHIHNYGNTTDLNAQLELAGVEFRYRRDSGVTVAWLIDRIIASATKAQLL